MFKSEFFAALALAAIVAAVALALGSVLLSGASHAAVPEQASSQLEQQQVARR